MQVQRKTTAARELSSLHFCPLHFCTERCLGGRNCQFWPSIPPVSTCSSSTCTLLICFLMPGLPQRLFQGRGGIKFLMSAAVARWTNKGRIPSSLWIKINPKSKQLVALSVHFRNANGHVSSHEGRETTGFLWNTYQAFGSWGAEARRDRWGDEAASLCCWGGCLSEPQTLLFFYRTKSKL